MYGKCNIIIFFTFIYFFQPFFNLPRICDAIYLTTFGLWISSETFLYAIIDLFSRTYTSESRVLPRLLPAVRKLRDQYIYIITALRPSESMALANPRVRFGCAITAKRN